MSYSPVKFVFFLKSRLLFNLFHCLCLFANKHCYFYINTNIKGDFQICISVLLNHERKIQVFVDLVVSNIFLNNKLRLPTDPVLADTPKSVKKRQREK